ncbi:hypothetical protein OIV19_18460 [Brucella sp. HL-2]|nr:hypothetical protein [Brucella sp. HL-2]MCV9909587.1 hypothetical protein [Brucella sp. HL-2]
MSDLGTIIINLGTLFPFIFQFVFILMALFGLWLCGHAFYEVYQVASEGPRSGHSYVGAGTQLLLGSACTIGPYIVARFANTVALGGEETASWLSYQPSGTSSAGQYCQDTQFAITGLLMVFGAIAIFMGVSILHGMRNQTRSGGVGQALFYIFAGVVAIFANDVATIIGNTIKMDVGLQQICTALGAGTG